jgi:hypothetical protein
VLDTLPTIDGAALRVLLGVQDADDLFCAAEDAPDGDSNDVKVNDTDKVSVWGVVRFYSAPKKINGG